VRAVIYRASAPLIRASEGYRVVCFWVKPLTLTVPLSTQMYIKKMGTGKLNVENIPPMDFISFRVQ